MKILCDFVFHVKHSVEWGMETFCGLAVTLYLIALCVLAALKKDKLMRASVPYFLGVLALSVVVGWQTGVWRGGKASVWLTGENESDSVRIDPVPPFRSHDANDAHDQPGGAGSGNGFFTRRD